MAREEVARVVADIARAIQSSDLLSLLRQEGENSSSSQKRSLPLLRRRNHPTVKCSLSEIPKSLLDEKVASIRNVLETIDAQKLLDLEILRHGPSSRGPRVRDGIYCRQIIDQITPALNLNDNDNDEDVSMSGCEDDNTRTNSSSRSSVVRYLHIAEVPNEYTIGIFVFGPHERIPLHDHPEMCVLSRVLYGDLQRLSLDLDRKGRNPNQHEGGFGDGSSFDDMETEEEDENKEEEENPNEASVSSIRQFLEKQSSSAKIDKNSSNNTNNNSNNSNGSSSSFFSAALSRSATWLQNNLYNNSSSSGIAMDDESGDFQYYNRRRNSHRQQQQQQAPRRSRRSRDATTAYPEGTKVAYRNAMDLLEAPQVASLYPYEGNLHEFVAGPYGAAVLDVLLPPYDDDRKRDCTFYHIRELPPSASASATVPTPTTTRRKRRSSNGRFSRATPTANHGGATTCTSTSTSSTATTTVRKGERNPPQPQPQPQQRVPCLIVPTGQPENFHCISGRYKDLGETDDYYDYQYEDD